MGELVCRRYKKLETLHEGNRAFLNEIAFYLNPDQNTWGNSYTKSSGHQKDEDLQQKTLLYDTSCRDFKDELVDVTLGRAIDPSFTWLKFIPVDTSLITQNNELSIKINKGLAKMADQFAMLLANSGFYPEITQFYENGGDYGFGAITPLIHRNKLKFRAENIFQVYFDEDDLKQISEIGYKRSLTGRQILDKYGNDKAVQVINKAFNMNYKELDSATLEDEQLLHLLKDFEVIVLYLREGDNWKCYAVEKQTKLVLDNKIFKYQPCTIFRMDRSTSMFGTGWGKKILEKAISLDQIKHDTARAFNWMTDPAFQVQDDGFLPDKINPGDILYGDLVTGDMLKPVNLQLKPEFGLEWYREEREGAKKTFKLDSFDFQKKEKQSIAEISEFAGIRNVRVTRFLYRFFDEGLIPLLQSAYYLCLEYGLMVKPEELSGIDIQFNIISPLFAQQRYAKVTNVTRAFQAVAPVLETDPSGRHLIDGKKIIADIWSEFGLSDKLRSEQEANEMAEQEKEQANQDVGSKSAKQTAEAERALAQAEAIKQGGE